MLCICPSKPYQNEVGVSQIGIEQTRFEACILKN